MKLFNKIGLLAIGAIMSLGAAIGVVGNEVIKTHAVELGELVYELTTDTAGTNNNYNNNCDVTVDGITWNVNGNSTMNPWRLGGKEISDVDRTLYSKTAMPSSICEVQLTVGTAADITVNSLKLIVASDSDYANKLDEVSATFTASSTITFNPTSGDSWASGAYYKFVFNVTVSATKNKFVQVSSAKFYGLASEARTVTGVAVSGELDKTTYGVGDAWDLSGLGLDIEYNNGDTETVPFADVDASTYTLNPATATDTTVTSFGITGTYEGIPYTHTVTGLTVIAKTWDVLTREETGVTNNSTSYKDWSYSSIVTGATYKGNSAGGNNSIQLRSNNQNSGIVATVSNGNVTNVTIEWQNSTSADRVLSVYGSNTAYTAVTDLYTASTQGTLLGSIDRTSTELDITGSYKYIGLRSQSGAMYLTSVTINYSLPTEADIEEAETYAQKFLDATTDVCAVTANAPTGTAPAALAEAWTAIEAEFDACSDKAYEYLANANAVTEENDVIRRAVERYDFCIAKYGSTLTNFLGRNVQSTTNNNILSIINNGNSSTNIILVVVIASMVIMGSVYLVIRRRKANVK